MIKKYKYLLIFILLFTSKSHALSPEYEKELYIGCYSNSKAYIGPDGAKIYCQCTVDKLSAKFSDEEMDEVFSKSLKRLWSKQHLRQRIVKNKK